MSNVFQTYLKGFKLKKMVVKPKTTQSIEPIKVKPQLIDPTLTDRPLPQQLEVWSRGGRGPTITCQVLHVND